MTERERDRMYQTALQQIAQQRAQAALASRDVRLVAPAAGTGGRATRVVSALLVAMLFSPVAAYAVKIGPVSDRLNHFTRSPYCEWLHHRQSWWSGPAYFLSGC